jgi:ABC-type dipeptide/oligopeptide/nickel transport system ATPase component
MCPAKPLGESRILLPQALAGTEQLPSGWPPGAQQQQSRTFHQAVCHRAEEFPVLHHPSRSRSQCHNLQHRRIGQGERKKLRLNMQMIFQDPFTSLNPRLSISDIIAEPLKVSRLVRGRKEMRKRVSELMDVCGLPNRYVNMYPHELDGGPRRRCS